MFSTRIIICEDCGGDGTVEAMPKHVHDTGRITKCGECNGTGEVEVECEPMTLDDIDDQNVAEAAGYLSRNRSRP